MENSITDVLYHRPPYLYLDEILECDAQMITALKKLRGDEPFFLGHFPGSPVVPGAMMCEMTFRRHAISFQSFSTRKQDRNLAAGTVTGGHQAKFKVFLDLGKKFKSKLNPLRESKKPSA